MASPRRREPAAQALSDRALRDVLRGRSEVVEGTEALRTLLSRRPQTAILTEVIADRSRPPELRAASAVALGRERKPSHTEALLGAVRDPDPSVARRAAEALGKIGDADALTALERVSPPGGPAARSVEFAKTLLSYRLGQDSHRIRRPPAKSELEVTSRRAEELKPAPPRGRARESIIADAAQELPGVDLSDAGMVRFSCGGHQYAIVLAEVLRRRGGLDQLGRRPAVAGALLERSPEIDRWFLAEYLLSDPGPRKTVRLLGVRPNGVVTHVGELRPEKKGSFEVRAVDTRFSPPVDIGGAWDTKAARMRISRMRVQPDFDPKQRQPVEPTKLT
jgi:hypothetical protein